MKNTIVLLKNNLNPKIKLMKNKGDYQWDDLNIVLIRYNNIL